MYIQKIKTQKLKYYLLDFVWAFVSERFRWCQIKICDIRVTKYPNQMQTWSSIPNWQCFILLEISFLDVSAFACILNSLRQKTLKYKRKNKLHNWLKLIVCLVIISKFSRKCCYYSHTLTTQMDKALLQQNLCSDELYKVES